MNKFIFKPIYIFALFAFVFTSCNNDDDNNNPAPVNEQEEITTLKITFTEQNAEGTAQVVEYSFQDLDGDGGNDPVFTSTGGNLKEGTDYKAEISILNENEDVDLTNKEYNVTLEIEEEDDEHQFFFEYMTTGDSQLFSAFSYDDQDGDSNPLGLATNWTTVEVSENRTGTLKITLLHEPDKSAEGVSNNDPANAGGETDIAVTFDITIENLVF